MQLAQFPSNLPMPLMQALRDLEASTHGLSGLDPAAGGGDFWMRLAAHLQGLEAVAGALPDDLDAESLAAWLASALSGEELPQGGANLPVPSLQNATPVALGEAPAADAHGGQDAGRQALSIREQLLASLPMLTGMADRGGQTQSAVGTLMEMVVASGVQKEAPIPQSAAAAVAPLGDTGAGVQISREAGFALPRALQLDVPLHQPGWDRALGDQVRWMANQNVQMAELRLNPPNLGPLEVRLQVDGDRTHINFVAPQAAVREALDAALPRLREMFAEGGLNLGDVTVSHQDARQAGDQGGRGTDGSGRDTGETGTGEDPSGVAAGGERRGLGLVDYYV